MPKQKNRSQLPLAFSIPLTTLVFAVILILIQKITFVRKPVTVPTHPTELLYAGKAYLCPPESTEIIQNAIDKQRPSAASQLKSMCSQVEKASYRCNDNRTIIAYYNIQNAEVSLLLDDGRYLTLPQAMAASGIRYTDRTEQFVFWSKGDTAFVTEQGKTTFDGCNETDK